MTSELRVDKIHNEGGDNDSGLDMSTNDVVAVKIAGSEKARVHSDGKVGIGTSSPNSTLTVSATGGSAGANFEVASINADFGSATTNDSFGGYLSFRHRTGGNLLVEPARIGVVGTSNNQGSLVFYGKGGTASATAPTEAMRIDTSNNAIIGKTTANTTAAGIVLNANGRLWATASGDDHVFNRLTSDGGILSFRKDNVESGGIGGKARSSSSRIFVGNSNTRLLFDNGVDAIIPANNDGDDRDNALDLGVSGARFDDIYATNGTIQTSDENEKQNIASLTSAEITAATAISKLFKTFKWKDKVTSKGNNARTHSGVVAQQVETAMSDAGLDASKYAFWCSNTWWEADEKYTDDNGKEQTRTNIYDTKDEAPKGATERNRKGIRYPELLSFIGASTEQRLTSIEARLTALEAK